MRHAVAALFACLLVGCASAPSRAPSCSSAYECEIEAYQRVGR